MSATNGHQESTPSENEITIAALSSQLASIRKLAENGWRTGKPCLLCPQVGAHSEHCYVRGSVGFDLLEEHEETLKENAQLRAALAKHLPTNGKHMISGGQFRSLRDRARGGRFSSHEG